LKQAAAVADLRHLNAKVSIAKITAEVENDWQESARKLAQAHGVLTNTVEKANRNWRAPVNFLPPCTEGQPY
jgi:hypothetical protein